MASDNFDAAFKLVLHYEGGYVNNPRDPGGPTNLGVTQRTLSSWLGRQATIAEVKALTPAKVAPIYRKQYWDHIMGDSLPEGVDYAVFDYAVNSGIVRAVMDLQRAMGVRPDGHLGLNTIDQLRGLDPAKVVGDVCNRRLRFMQGLRTWKTFGKGWSSRVNGVRANALQMSRKLGLDTYQPASLMDTGSKANPEDQAPTSLGAGQAGMLGGLGAVGGVATQAADQVQALSDYVEWAKWVFIGLTVLGIGIGLYITYKKAGQSDSSDLD